MSKDIESKMVLIDPDKVLEGAVGELQAVAIVGIGNDSKVYVASSHGVPITNYLLDLGKDTILNLTKGEDRAIN